jgi:hypothetical protein
VSVIPAVHRWRTNAHLIADVARLGYLDGEIVLDVTYGRGGFWERWRPAGLVAHDLYTLDRVDFRHLPEADASVDVVVLDPPYRLNGRPDRGDFDERFGTDRRMRWQDKHQLIRDGITEAARVLRVGGYLALKCQDQVCLHRVRWQTREFPDHAEMVGFELVDRFDMIGTARLQPPGRIQRHAHGRPSALLVFRKAVP